VLLCILSRALSIDVYAKGMLACTSELIARSSITQTNTAARHIHCVN